MTGPCTLRDRENKTLGALPVDFLTLVHQWWDVWWNHLDSQSELECDVTQISLTIGMPNGRVYLFNIHERMEQMWLSSPVSGGHHFTYQLVPVADAQSPGFPCPQPYGHWIDTRAQKRLQDMIMQEWQEHYAIHIPWLG